MAVVIAMPAAGQEAPPPPWKPRPNVIVRTQPDAAVLEADAIARQPGSPGQEVVSPKRRCHLEVQGNIGFGSAALWAEHPDETLFAVSCEGKIVGFVWRRIDPTPSPARRAGAREIATHLRDEIPVPNVEIRINPLIGLVGTESWFWLEGYSGAPIVKSTDALGSRVDVEATVTGYDWVFGDGTGIAGTSPGRPYPERSEVRHVFERSSTTADGYRVRVQFTFDVRYRIDGGEWNVLPGISRETTAHYRVIESQAVIVR